MKSAAVAATLVWGLAGAALAHDTFIVPPPGVTAGEPVVVLVTSSSFFPEPETRIRPERIARLDARAGGAPLTWSATNDDVAMTLTTSPAASAEGGAVVVMSLAPYDIDVGAEEVPLYMEEIGADQGVRAAVDAAVAANGSLAETYTKHLKTIVCAATCVDNARPGSDTFEFVHAPGGGRVFTLFLNGAPMPGQAVFVLTETVGRVALATDAQGRVELPEGLMGLVYLSAVRLSLPEAEGGRFTSDWASLTFDARLLTQ